MYLPRERCFDVTFQCKFSSTVLEAFSLHKAGLTLCVQPRDECLCSLQLDAPLFVTWYQCAVTLLLCAVLGTLATAFPEKITFPPFRVDAKVSREVRLEGHRSEFEFVIFFSSGTHPSSQNFLAGAASVGGVRVYDHVQQPVSEVRGRLLLLRGPLSHHRLQCGEYSRHAHTRTTTSTTPRFSFRSTTVGDTTRGHECRV